MDGSCPIAHIYICPTLGRQNIKYLPGFVTGLFVGHSAVQCSAVQCSGRFKLKEGNVEEAMDESPGQVRN
jgi:hypothetical protein